MNWCHWSRTKATSRSAKNNVKLWTEIEVVRSACDFASTNQMAKWIRQWFSSGVLRNYRVPPVQSMSPGAPQVYNLELGNLGSSKLAS